MLKAALVAQLGGAADESHLGDLSWVDARRRLEGAAAGRTRSSSSSSTRRALGSAGSSVTISVDAEVEVEVFYTADDDGATTADIAALVIAAVQPALTVETVRSSALLDSIADTAAAAGLSASFASIAVTGAAAASALAPTAAPTPEPAPFDWGRDEEPWHPVFGTDPHADCPATLPPGSARACAVFSAATAVGGGSGARVASLWPSGTLPPFVTDTPCLRASQAFECSSIHSPLGSLHNSSYTDLRVVAVTLTEGSLTGPRYRKNWVPDKYRTPGRSKPCEEKSCSAFGIPSRGIGPFWTMLVESQ